MREPQAFHPIKPEPEVQTAYPDTEEVGELERPDVERRSERKRTLDRNLHRRIDRRVKGKAARAGDELGRARAEGNEQGAEAKGRTEEATDEDMKSASPLAEEPKDSIAARARKRLKGRSPD